VKDDVIGVGGYLPLSKNVGDQSSGYLVLRVRERVSGDAGLLDRNGVKVRITPGLYKSPGRVDHDSRVKGSISLLYVLMYFAVEADGIVRGTEALILRKPGIDILKRASGPVNNHCFRLKTTTPVSVVGS
jgi:hypothetical protein